MLAQDMLPDVAKPLRPIETLDQRLRAIIERHQQTIFPRVDCPYCPQRFESENACSSHIGLAHRGRRHAAP